MTFNALTIFPRLFRGFLEETMMKRAVEAGIATVNLVNVRDYATDKHQTTDDTPYGGGPGMVMKIEPIYNALASLIPAPEKRPTDHWVILLSARGQQFTQAKAEKLSKITQLTLICGRYEGVDQRVADHLCDEELSIGPYVLSGGEVAAMVVIETVSRLLPGFLGNPESLKEESFASGLPRDLSRVARGAKLEAPNGGGERSGEHPHYTKPEDFLGWKVPDVLLSGHHKNIAEWRRTQMRKTQ
mgnify:CR=1 FL=1